MFSRLIKVSDQVTETGCPVVQHGGTFGTTEGGVANVHTPVKDCHALIPAFDIAGNCSLSCPISFEAHLIICLLGFLSFSKVQVICMATDVNS